MHITELKVENIKRVNAVNIKPDGAIIEITGRNGQGKSSVLDSIAYGLGGKDEIPSKPIREGADEARIVIELDDLVVTRKWTAKGATYLTVEGKNGARFPSPQAILDKMTGDLTFDPLAFSRMSPKDQVVTLKKVAGLDFTGLDRERQNAFEERTIVNRKLKDANGALTNTPEVEAPAEEASLSDLIEQQNAAIKQQQANNNTRGYLHHMTEKVAQLVETRDDTAQAETSRRADFKQRIAALEKQIEAVEVERAQWIESHRKNLEAIEVNIQEFGDKRKEADVQVNQLTDPDLEAIAAQIAGAEESQEKVRAAQQRAALVAQCEEYREAADALTNRISGIDHKKLHDISAANLPVEGLGFDENGISFNGLPFDQASAAEQLRVSVAMGTALNPKLRVMLIRDGSLLDKDSLALLAEMAEANDTQIWIERVSDGEDVGIVIEDGYVRGAEAEAGKQEAVATA